MSVCVYHLVILLAAVGVDGSPPAVRIAGGESREVDVAEVIDRLADAAGVQVERRPAG